MILSMGVRPGVDGAPGGAEAPGSVRAWHVLPSGARQAGRGWNGEGRDGGAGPVFAAAVVINNVDL